MIVELKPVERVSPAHKKQVLTYLRWTGLKLGYLLNFGEALMRDGITRIIHGTLDPDPPCLGASVRVNFIEPGSPPNAAFAPGTCQITAETRPRSPTQRADRIPDRNIQHGLYRT
ncbi:MAG: GxxExxY protein [Verrucomicrobiota bacterium]